MSEQRIITLDAEQFLGQPIEGFDIEHLGVDDKGLPISQAIYRFPGGEMTAYQGDWIAPLPGGQKIIIAAKTWAELDKPAPVPEPTPAPIPALTPDEIASWHLAPGEPGWQDNPPVPAPTEATNADTPTT